MAEKVSLILEGGGMRGAYTAGVLDFFHDEGVEFPLVVTASSSSIIGSSYVAKQRGRNQEILKTLVNSTNSISYLRMLRQRELFGMDFIFHTIPNELLPFDFDTFSQSNTTFVVSTTDIHTGEAVYYDTYPTKKDLLTVMRASSSLPMLASSVRYQEKELMDGGIADPIPITPATIQGYKKHVIILTRNEGYVKKATKLNWLFKHAFKDKYDFRQALKNRHNKYNQTMELVKEMEKRGDVLLIQPEEPLQVRRTERKKEKLYQLYQQGYQEAETYREQLHLFLGGDDQTKAL
ncbi:patatin-like phospholipase family protein [Alteribacillus iranensis]|uniref:Predicted phospholipase, patatin/cPLA2 family n=1 Tax=Alteribacillus iranensis TaxID=930128 RepID=A0A1I2DJT2_9BACI|nr:patatin family protein [Alteribacillus iranensis]SFE80824.1 Predicted phospholipase, patatin/cPLA2 family [Alteribacillus iranensis]